MGNGKDMINKERGVFRESLHIVGQYFKARLLISLILGGTCYLFMWFVLDLNGRLPVSIIVALFNLVPYIGPIASIIIAAIVVVFQHPIDVFWMTVFLFGFQIIDAVLLSPLIMGKSMGLHPVVVFVAIFIGGSVWGVLGMIIATPVAAIAALLARRIKKRLREKNRMKIAQDTDSDSDDVKKVE